MRFVIFPSACLSVFRVASRTKEWSETREKASRIPDRLSVQIRTSMSDRQMPWYQPKASTNSRRDPTSPPGRPASRMGVQPGRRVDDREVAIGLQIGSSSNCSARAKPSAGVGMEVSFAREYPAFSSNSAENNHGSNGAGHVAPTGCEERQRRGSRPADSDRLRRTASPGGPLPARRARAIRRGETDPVHTGLGFPEVLIGARLLQIHCEHAALTLNHRRAERGRQRRNRGVHGTGWW